MARRKEKGKMQITSKDRAFLQVLAKTGRCLSEDVETYFGIKKSRLNKMIHNEYLVKEAIMVNRQPQYCYMLTQKARRWISKNISTVRIHYKPSNRGTIHDILLFQQLGQLPRHLQDVAMPEKEVSKIFGQVKGCSPPDIFIPSTSYTNSLGNLVETATQVIEVVTKNYSAQEIQEKIDYCRDFLGVQGGMNFVHVN